MECTFKFHPNRINPELWRHMDFWSWRKQHGNSTSDFVFGDFAQLGRSKFTCMPNFGNIIQSTAEILLLLPMYLNYSTPVCQFSRFDHCVIEHYSDSLIWSCHCSRSVSESESFHAGILLPVSIFTFASSSTCHSASVYQISSKSNHLRHT